MIMKAAADAYHFAIDGKEVRYEGHQLNAENVLYLARREVDTPWVVTVVWQGGRRSRLARGETLQLPQVWHCIEGFETAAAEASA